MDVNAKMVDLFNAVADMTIEKVKNEKETTLSEETVRMISLTQSLHNSINCSVRTAPLF